ncbi:MAG: hypothetical protein J6F30_04640 [Cellulosilyticum sp.]|nr:hypothetical protein [Cellulosilyticum sp.]
MSRLRPFYFEADVDGYPKEVAAGPKAKDGRMNIEIYQRDNGEKVKAFSIRSFTELDGKLKTIVCNHEGQTVVSFVTDY